MERLERTESIEVAYETDVCVVGGGPAGVGAAFAAARRGKRVLVVEQANCLGGVATSGLHGHICVYCEWGGGRRIVGGIAHEIAERVVHGGVGAYNGISLDFEVEGLKRVLEVMASEAGDVRLLYYTQFSDVVVEDGRITHVIVQSKSGRQAIRANVVVDCTGDADVAARAGVPFEMGRAKDGRCQPMTLMFQLGGVDTERALDFRWNEYAQKYSADDPWQMTKLWEEAQRNGDMEPFQKNIMGWWYTPTRPDQLGVNFTHITNRSTVDAEDLTYATIEGRRQAYHTVEVYRNYVPGMENCWLSHTAAVVGTRESRRIVGETVITEQDLIDRKEFTDSIGYGSFFIDVHCCDGPGMDDETWRPPHGFRYQIPYRALVPKKVDNLLVAGRCISCTHIALGSLRVMPQCILEGEAAGVAAELADSAGRSPRDLDVTTLQAALRDQGGILFEEDIPAAEGKPDNWRFANACTRSRTVYDSPPCETLNPYSSSHNNLQCSSG